VLTAKGYFMKTFSRYIILIVGMSLFSGCSWFKIREEDRSGAIPVATKAIENVIKVTDKAQFEDLIKTTKYVVVDFFATWCPPCQTMLGINKKIAEKLTDIKIIEVDIDKLKEVASEHGVMGVPTFFFYKDGKKVMQAGGQDAAEERHVGAMSEKEYEEKVRSLFGL
jgi:thioredoxin 1